MSKVFEVKAKRRDKVGKSSSRKARAEGWVPAELYGFDIQENHHLLLPKREVEPLLRGDSWSTQVLSITVEGEGEPLMALIKEVQRHPLTGELLHLDLYHLVRGHVVTVEVPVHLVGKDVCPGLKLGGVLEHFLHEIEVECDPRLIPDEIKVDISKLEIDDVVYVKDLQLPEGVKATEDPDAVVLVIAAPRVEEEAAPAAAAVSAAEVPTVAEQKREARASKEEE